MKLILRGIRRFTIRSFKIKKPIWTHSSELVSSKTFFWSSKRREWSHLTLMSMLKLPPDTKMKCSEKLIIIWMESRRQGRHKRREARVEEVPIKGPISKVKIKLFWRHTIRRSARSKLYKMKFKSTWLKYRLECLRMRRNHLLKCLSLLIWRFKHSYTPFNSLQVRSTKLKMAEIIWILSIKLAQFRKCWRKSKIDASKSKRSHQVSVLSFLAKI